MAFDRIITLSLNPVIDTTLHLDGLNIRAENRVLEEHFEAAGKAVNVARALKRAGVESTAEMRSRSKYRLEKIRSTSDTYSMGAKYTPQ